MPDEYSRQEVSVIVFAVDFISLQDLWLHQVVLLQCSKIEQHYLDHFLSLIQKDVDPQTICSLAQLCGSSKQPSAAAQPAKAVSVARHHSTLQSRLTFVTLLARL